MRLPNRLSILAATAILTTAVQAAAVPMLGFLDAEAAEQRSLEQRFDAGLSAGDFGPWLKQLAAEANNVGTPHDKANADFLLERFRTWGWKADIEVFYVLYPTPKHTVLEMIAPTNFKASLHEPPIEGDSTSARTDGLPSYN